MDELIVLLIKGIIRLFAGPPPVNRRTFATPPAAAAPPARPPAARPPAARPRGGRRTVTAAVAAPILTGTRADAPAVPPPTTPRAKVATATATKPPTAATINVRKWVTPKALRQQVIVSEILRPPLALRGNE